ncbi:MAG: hypothetical protein HRU15_09930 [Planctomycetes bacterium]|nr:hypothetical protein [Planctomycetota bacterium]
MNDYKKYLPANTSSELASLLDNIQAMPLDPGTPCASHLDQLQSITIDDICAGDEVKNEELASCCLTALWLAYNYLDRGHDLTQNQPSPSGSYWHAIMHRREPDYSNSAYWFRKTGEHEIFTALNNACNKEFPRAAISQSDKWDVEAFNNLCEKNLNGGPDQGLCKNIQLLEWCLLFNYCYQGARA